MERETVPLTEQWSLAGRAASAPLGTEPWDLCDPSSISASREEYWEPSSPGVLVHWGWVPEPHIPRAVIGVRNA